MLALALAFGMRALSAAEPPSATRGPESAATVPIEASTIALVLPLTSATYGRVADAVKGGFTAAADRAGAKVAIVAHGDGDVVAAFAKAKDSGARVIVGPLVRDDVKTLAAAGLELPWTIALNQLDDGAPLPSNTYALTLSIESDGRQLARYMRGNGARTVAVIASDSLLQLRLAAAFVDEWLLLGGGPPDRYHFDRNPGVLALLKKELARTPPDTALLAVDASDAALAKPYLGSIAVCTSNQVNDRQTRPALNDLDDVCFVEIPWLADPEAPAFAKLKHPALPNASLDRLYALGIDAFRVAQVFAEGPVDGLEFDGATGRVTLRDNGQFSREGKILRFHDGAIERAEVR